MLSVKFVGVPINAEEVFVGSEIIAVVEDEFVDDFVNRILFVFDLFVEIVVDVELVWNCLVQVELVTLSQPMITLRRSLSSSLVLDKRLMITTLPWYSFFKN